MMGTSAVHRALLVEEIAERIAKETAVTVDGLRRDCTALALTCKALFEPAMTVAWCDITDFNKLFRCLPNHVCDPEPHKRLSVSGR